MHIICHVAYVYFNDLKPSIEFNSNEYTPVVDMKHTGESLIVLNNWKIVKLKYRSLSIDNEGKI